MGCSGDPRALQSSPAPTPRPPLLMHTPTMSSNDEVQSRMPLSFSHCKAQSAAPSCCKDVQQQSQAPCDTHAPFVTPTAVDGPPDRHSRADTKQAATACIAGACHATSGNRSCSAACSCCLPHAPSCLPLRANTFASAQSQAYRETATPPANNGACPVPRTLTGGARQHRVPVQRHTDSTHS